MALKADQITAKNFKEFYDRLYPYLNGAAHAGFTPIGTIISVMGNTAPTNYLACQGQSVNIADFPELANYFVEQFGSNNYFGGDGTTTFAVPDLRGEFLRGTGTNSHANNGNGAAVGTHQDGTQHVWLFNDNSNNNISLDAIGNAQYAYEKNEDTLIDDATHTGAKYYALSKDSNNKNWHAQYTSRPTNTSVLYCIATKDIYIDAKYDYSLSEKVVGTWIDGKPIYQKTVEMAIPQAVTNGTSVKVEFDISSWNIDRAIKIDYSYTDPNVMLGSGCYFATDGHYRLKTYIYQNDLIVSNENTSYNDGSIFVTVQYTKTTDSA